MMLCSPQKIEKKNYILTAGTGGAEGSNVCGGTRDTEESNNFGGISLSVVITWSQ